MERSRKKEDDAKSLLGADDLQEREGLVWDSEERGGCDEVTPGDQS